MLLPSGLLVWFAVLQFLLFKFRGITFARGPFDERGQHNVREQLLVKHLYCVQRHSKFVQRYLRASVWYTKYVLGLTGGISLLSLCVTEVCPKVKFFMCNFLCLRKLHNGQLYFYNSL